MLTRISNLRGSLAGFDLLWHGRFVKFLVPASDFSVKDQGAEWRPGLHFWKEFIAKVAIFPIGVKLRRQIEP